MLLCRQRRTEPRPQVASTENFVKFGHVVFEICELTANRQRETGKHADTKVAILRTLPRGGGKVITHWIVASGEFWRDAGRCLAAAAACGKAT